MVTKLVTFLLAISFAISLVWVWVSDFSFEAIIVAISIFISMIVSEVVKNKSVIKGSRNSVFQKRASKGSNESEIDGDDNNIIQL